MNMTNSLSKNTVKKTGHTLLSAIMIACLAACGGDGGGGGDSDSSNSSASNPINSSPVSSNPVDDLEEDESDQDTSSIDITRTADLVVPEAFVFLENDDLAIQVSSSDEAYVSICGSDSEGVNYNDCVMRTWVRADDFTTTVKIPRHIASLVAAVIVPSKSSTPTVYSWDRDSGMQWHITL